MLIPSKIILIYAIKTILMDPMEILVPFVLRRGSNGAMSIKTLFRTKRMIKIVMRMNFQKVVKKPHVMSRMLLSMKKLLLRKKLLLKKIPSQKKL
jgi:hypothetical protein